MKADIARLRIPSSLDDDAEFRAVETGTASHWMKPWVIPTQNSVYEVDFVRQRARRLSGSQSGPTDCFTPEGEWKRFITCSFGYAGSLVFSWPRSAPHDMTVTSPVRPAGLRYSEPHDVQPDGGPHHDPGC